MGQLRLTSYATGKLLSLSNYTWMYCLFLFALSLSFPFEMSGQYVSIPDSEYVENEFIVWFRPGVLNYAYYGCTDDGEIGDPEQTLPISIDFIGDPEIVNLFNSLSVTRLSRVVPFLQPCRDTISISRRGISVEIPDFWNVLRVEFDKTDLPYDIPNLCYMLTMYYQNVIKLAEPSLILHFSTSAVSPGSTSTATYINPNDAKYSEYAQWVPSVSRFGTQVYSLTSGVPCAWEKHMGAKDVRLAIIDDGVDSRHLDFQSPSAVVVGGWNYISNNSTTDDASYHGTRVAGIIAARVNNDYGVAGIAGGSDSSSTDNVKLVVLKIGDGYTQPGSGSVAKGVAAIIHASTQLPNSQPDTSGWGCHILNLSWADYPSEVLRSAVVYSYMNDVLAVSAIPDAVGGISYISSYDTPVYPAGCDDPWVLCVGGNDRNNLHAGSTYGPGMDILAPFSNHTLGVKFYPGGPVYDSITVAHGTSFSTPHCAGISALIMGYRDSLQMSGEPVPTYLAPEDITMLLAEGASIPPIKHTDKLPVEKTDQYGYGVANALSSISLLSSPYSLVHDTVRYAFDASNFTLDTVAIAFPSKYRPFSSVQDLIYHVRKYRIVADIYFGNSYPHAKRIWCRGTPSEGAFPDIRSIYDSSSHKWVKLPLYRSANWAKVISFTSDMARVETYIYQYRRTSSQGWQWLEIDSTNLSILFALTILNDSNYTVPVGTLDAPRNLEIGALYPNPAKHESSEVIINIYSSTGHSISLKLVDIYGRVVYNHEIVEPKEATNISVPVRRLGSGIYLVAITQDNHRVCKKLVIL